MKPDLMILSCSRSGMFCGAFVDGLLETAARVPEFMGFAKITEDSDIARARSRLLSECLQGSDATRFLWIDDDMGFRARHVRHILDAQDAHACHVIGGLYSKRREGGGLVFMGPPGEEIPGNRDICAVAAVGTGFMLVSRAVLQDLQKHCEELPTETGGKWWHFFEAGIVREAIGPVPVRARYLTEDYAFCRKVNNFSKFQVHLHRGIKLTHRGHAEFRVS